MYSTRIALVAVCLVLVGHEARAQQREPFPGIDAYVANATKTWKTPGLSIAIVRNDSVLFTKGYGVLSVGSMTPVNDRTLFEIGSTTKAFTATLVASLVTDGKMRFDDRVSDYLPSFKLQDPVASAELTVRDAMTHRSGLPRGELMWLGSGVSRDELLHRLRFLKPESVFRSQFSYQNVVFVVAGEAAAKAGGSSWESLIEQRIFAPLGMTDSRTSSKGMTNQNATLPHGMDRDSVLPKPYMNGQNIAPAGAILSSARDMAQWLRFQMGDGMFNGKRVVSSAALRETHTPQIVVGGLAARGRAGDAVPTTVFSTYGMGWIVEDYRRNLYWHHSGGTEGMTSEVAMLPERRFGVVVLSNMASNQLPGLIVQYVLDRELGLPVRDVSAEAFARTAAQRRLSDSMQVVQAGQRVKGEPPVPLSKFVGSYSDSTYGDATITMVGGRLQLRRGDWQGPLEFVNAVNFRWVLPPGSPVGALPIRFEVSPQDAVTGLYFGIGNDISLMGRKSGTARGDHGGFQ